MLTQNKFAYLKGLLHLLIFSIYGCQQVPSCDVYRKQFYKKNIDIIVTDLGPIGREFHITGIDPVTHHKIDYRDSGGLFSEIRNNMQVGDTLTKKARVSYYMIKKTKTNIVIDIKCDGELYLESNPETLKKKDKMQ